MRLCLKSIKQFHSNSIILDNVTDCLVSNNITQHQISKIKYNKKYVKLLYNSQVHTNRFVNIDYFDPFFDLPEKKKT